MLWLAKDASVTDAVSVLEHVSARAVEAPVTTAQVAPTILKSLGLDPTALEAVRAEGAPVLPGVAAQLTR